MSKKNKIIITIAVIAVIILSSIAFLATRNSDAGFTLSIAERRWLNNNNDTLVNVNMLDSIPVFSYEGNGVFFNFINALSRETDLQFNLIPYQNGDEITFAPYAFRILPAGVELGDNDLLFYEDTYVIISNDLNSINNLTDLRNPSIGVLETDLEIVTNIMSDVSNPTFTEAETVSALFEAMDENLDVIVIPYNYYLPSIINHDSNIIYHISDLTKKYVLTTSSDNEQLTGIITKYFEDWVNRRAVREYNRSYLDTYFRVAGITEQDKSAFSRKSYTVGFIDNAPYNFRINGVMTGLVVRQLNDFARLTNADITYQEFTEVEGLRTALANGDIDIALNLYTGLGSENTITSPTAFDNEVYVLARRDSFVPINARSSLANQSIAALENTPGAAFFDNTIESDVVTYNNLNNLFNADESKKLVTRVTYEYFRNRSLSDYTPVFRIADNHNYAYLINDSDENQVFINLFNFYLNGIDNKVNNSVNLDNLINNPVRGNIFTSVIAYIIYVVILLIGAALAYLKFFAKKPVKKIGLTKEDKVKYIDQLTSLKNRNYLNEHINEWDDTGVYPQTLAVVDLNNIKYVNDNYGHEAGDELIKKAAGILINNQLDNSDIMRIDGNEFLIYLVGYTEAEVVSYIRKLNRELKTLPYDFGAAIGFSMINDEIKTIDDAINEAILDMRVNKNLQKD